MESHKLAKIVKPLIIVPMVLIQQMPLKRNQLREVQPFVMMAKLQHVLIRKHQQHVKLEPPLEHHQNAQMEPFQYAQIKRSHQLVLMDLQLENQSRKLPLSRMHQVLREKLLMKLNKAQANVLMVLWLRAQRVLKQRFAQQELLMIITNKDVLMESQECVDLLQL
jgi:hypothetical protein